MDKFTKRKFLNFSEEKKHKKCAELLKMAFEGSNDALNNYNEIQIWMGGNCIENDQKLISNYFHHHRKKSNDHHLILHNIRRGDRISSELLFPITIYLDHLRSAHNVGSIIRTVEAFSLGSVFFSHQTPGLDHPQVKKTSMGSWQWVKRVENFEGPIIALETCERAISIFDFTFPKSFTLAVGNEEYGCSDEILNISNHFIDIPMRGRKNSLNVANAFAIAAAEIVRQKKG